MTQGSDEEFKPGMIPRDYQMRIARDGTWFHQGDPIRRHRLVKLFATVLSRRDDGQYWLKTPAEQGIIEVEDAPFVVQAMRVENAGREDQTIHFITNLDHDLTLSADTPLVMRISPVTGEVTPYVEMPRGLSARLGRTVFYELVDHAVARSGADDVAELGVVSDGMFFSLGQVSDDDIPTEMATDSSALMRK